MLFSMAAMTLRKACMEKLILKLKQDYPTLTFTKGSLLCWSPIKQQIFYDPTANDKGVYGVLHEIGHARLNHTSYETDADLVKKEILAWEEAYTIAKEYDVLLDDEHVQDCLDTYRDWLHKRSTCPTCSSKGIQTGHERYTCINCQHQWQVSHSQLCRPYRRSK